jgi:hypothetical protein
MNKSRKKRDGVGMNERKVRKERKEKGKVDDIIVYCLSALYKSISQVVCVPAHNFSEEKQEVADNRDTSYNKVSRPIEFSFVREEFYVRKFFALFIPPMVQRYFSLHGCQPTT